MVPAIIEAYVSMVRAKINDSTWLQRQTYNTFLPVGYRIAKMKLGGQKINRSGSLPTGLPTLHFFARLKTGGASPSAE